jgi:PAS domain S-box-containing protein
MSASAWQPLVEAPPAPPSLLAWRETTLKRLIYLSFLLALPVMLAITVNNIRIGRPWEGVVAAGLLLVLIGVARAQRRPGQLRSWLLVGMFLLISAYGLYTFGLHGVSPHYGTLAVLFAAVLLGRRAALIALATQTLLVVLIYSGYGSGLIPPPPGMAAAALRPSILFNAGLNILAISSVVTLVLIWLIGIFEHSLTSAQQSLAALTHIRTQSEEMALAHAEQLRRNALLLAATQRVARVGGWEYDTYGQALSWTDELYDIFQVPREVVPDFELLRTFYSDDAWATLRGAVEQLLDAGTPYHLELPARTMRGRAIWVRMIGSIERGEAIDRYVGAMQNITARKEAELALARQVRYAEALSHCSQVLLTPIRDRGERQALLEQALAALHQTTGIRCELLQRWLIKGEQLPPAPPVDSDHLPHWDEATSQLLGTAAEMFASALQSWDTADALRERETQIRSISANMPNGMFYQFVRYPDGSVAFPYTGGAVERLTGYTRQQIDAEPALLLDTIVESDAARYEAAVDESARNLTVFEFETQRRLADGSLCWVQFCSTPRRLPDGAVVWDGIQMDITPRKEAERALQAAHARLETLLEHSPAVIFSLCPANEFLASFVSANVVKLTGYQPADFTTDTAFHRERTHPEDEAYVDERASYLLVAGQTDYEYRFRCADGAYRWMRAELRLVLDSDGQPLEAVGCWMDITARKQVELALRASEARYRRLFEASMDAILITDEEGYCLDANAAAAKLFAVERSKLLGKHVGQLRLADGTSSAEQYAQYLERGYDRGEFGFLRPDGTQCVAQYTAARIGPALHQSILRDISEQKAAEAALECALAAAEAAAHAKSEFVAQMSHEIRTPLNAVIGLTTLLLTSSLTPMQRDDVETIRRSGNALLTLIDDILDFSKIEAGKLNLEYHPFGLRACVEEALDLLAPLADAKHLVLRYAPDPALPDEFIGDPARLRQILVNLLSNAVRFTERGEVVVVLSGHARISDDDDATPWEIAIDVCDTGVGIAPEHLDWIFQPFTQAGASATRRSGGTGLGLTISRRLAELMGGQIQVASRLGVGSTFTLGLSLMPTDSPPPPYLASAQPLLADKRVLVLADRPDVSELLARQLAAWRMQTTVCATAAEACTRLQDGIGVDVIVLAYQAVDGASAALVGELRVIAAQPALPIIIWAALSQRGPVLSAVDPATTAVLTLPLRPAALYDALHTLLDASAIVSRPDTPLIDEAMGLRHPLRILLAEDNATNQQVAQRLLGKLGYQADMAANGLAVLDALRRQSYDLILMDVQMPEMSGTETTHYIRTFWPPERQPRIAAMTAYASKENRAWLLSTGMDDYVRKPVRLEELTQVLQAAVAARAASPAAQARALPAEAQVIDAVVLAEFLHSVGDGDADEDAALLAHYLADMDAQVELLRDAVAADDAPRFARIAHTLKGLSLQVGALELGLLCGRLETAGKQESAAEGAVLLGSIDVVYPAVRRALVDYGMLGGVADDE